MFRVQVLGTSTGEHTHTVVACVKEGCPLSAGSEMLSSNLTRRKCTAAVGVPSATWHAEMAW